MMLCEFGGPGGGNRVDFVENGYVVDITSPSMLDLIRQGGTGAGSDRPARAIRSAPSWPSSIAHRRVAVRTLSRR